MSSIQYSSILLQTTWHLAFFFFSLWFLQQTLSCSCLCPWLLRQSRNQHIFVELIQLILHRWSPQVCIKHWGCSDVSSLITTTKHLSVQILSQRTLGSASLDAPPCPTGYASALILLFSTWNKIRSQKGLRLIWPNQRLATWPAPSWLCLISVSIKSVYRCSLSLGPRTFTELLCLCSVTQSCLTLFDPVDYSPPGSSVHRILQERTLGWVAISSSRGSSPHRDLIWVSYGSCIGSWFLYH